MGGVVRAACRRLGGSCRDGGRASGEPETCEGGPFGKEPPEIDHEQSHAGDDGFFPADFSGFFIGEDGIDKGTGLS